MLFFYGSQFWEFVLNLLISWVVSGVGTGPKAFEDGPFEGEWQHYMAPNLPSDKGMENVVQGKNHKECTEGRKFGPFSAPPILSLHISPLGVVPMKKNIAVICVCCCFVPGLMSGGIGRVGSREIL